MTNETVAALKVRHGHGGYRRLVVAILAILALALSACSSSDSSSSAPGVEAGPGVRVVDVDQAVTMLGGEPAPTIIDVRTPAEFAEGHLDGAVLVDFNAADFRDRIAEFPRDANYVIYCRSGNRSAGARQIMTELGFNDVADIGGGVIAWAEAGQPFVS